MTLQQVIENYGYVALFIGTFLEGETVLVIAGFLAHRGYMDIRWVVVLAIIGSMCGDQLFFYLGRRKGRAFLQKRPKWQRKAERLQSLINRFQIYILLTFRFFYGLRNVTPFLIGTMDYDPKRFFVLNMIGACVWAVVVGGAGYIFGHAVEAFLKDAKKYEVAVLIVIAAVGTTLAAVYYIRLALARRREAENPAPPRES